MLELTRKSITEQADQWLKAGIKLPSYDVAAVENATRKNPVWIHFGAGNIFRGFIGELMQKLLNRGLSKEGIIAVDTFDYDIIDKIYLPHDCLTLGVLMNPDGKLDKEVLGGIVMGLKGDSAGKDYETLKEMICSPGLQMLSFTITEKGYALRGLDGTFLPVAAQDIEAGPDRPKHAMSIVAALLYERYLHGKSPIAVVSMDNCSHNGEKLKNSVVELAKAWEQAGKIEAGFVNYLEDESLVSFPWSMIDKITPRPSEKVEAQLKADGIMGMEPVITDKKTFIAPFVNAEVPQYLVIEDKFPNGRPCLEQAGVYLTDRDTVNKTETMKVTTCLNPLHTALAVYGCLLGYDSIAAEMKDQQLSRLVEKIGYEEGMPVVVNPGIIDPMAFIKEVIEKRLPNPYIPDMPQRIATDTSQKVGIRFGETIKSYRDRSDLDPSALTYIPLALAGWLRYLLGVDDNGAAFERSADPMLPELTKLLEGVELGKTETYRNNLQPVLKNESLFGVDLYQVGLGEKVEAMFLDMLAGPGAVRSALKAFLG